MPIFNAALRHIDPQETKRYAGLGKTPFPDGDIDRACLEAQLLIQPRGIWEIYDYQAEQGLIQSVPAQSVAGKTIRKHLARAQKIAVLAVTLGEQIEHAIHAAFKNGDYAHGLLLDAAATTAVETAADEMEKAIRQSVWQQGLCLIPRFSPGYGDWDIRFQPQMLALTHAETIGISLTESCMLIPRKSVTAVIGLISSASAPIDQKKTCKTCTKINCLARKENHQ